MFLSTRKKVREKSWKNQHGRAFATSWSHETPNYICIWKIWGVQYVYPPGKFTYHPKSQFWRWFSFSHGGICDRSLEGNGFFYVPLFIMKKCMSLVKYAPSIHEILERNEIGCCSIKNTWEWPPPLYFFIAQRVLGSCRMFSLWSFWFYPVKRVKRTPNQTTQTNVFFCCRAPYILGAQKTFGPNSWPVLCGTVQGLAIFVSASGFINRTG